MIALSRRIDNFLRQKSLKDLLYTALAVKLLVLLTMAISCRVLPTHDPGADVHRFLLRNDELTCFSLKGTFCNCEFDCNWQDHGDATTCYERGLEAPQNVLQSHVYPFLLEPLTRWDAARFLQIALVPQSYTPNLTDCGKKTPCSFEASEKAHVFFPFFPTIIQHVARQLLHIPRSLLPTTCEQVMTLAALLVNLVASLWATVALYQLSKISLPDQMWVNRVTFLFICNPAQVFFATAYSESVFAALIFSGCWAWASKLEIAPILASLCWYLATNTRSNGVVYVGYVILGMIGGLVGNPDSQSRLSGLLVKFANIYVIFRALYDHNQSGIKAHCSVETNRPEWCDEALASSTFSLYHYVQAKHWNVGLFRYFEIKQIPNFLLAAPMLALAFWGSFDWLYFNWKVRAPARSFGGIAKFTLEVCQGFAKGENALGHYAVLGVSALIGLTVAHVQISTRLICSTCPAIYWFMASKIWANAPNTTIVGESILYYSFLYAILGVTLHSSWYPWT